MKTVEEYAAHIKAGDDPAAVLRVALREADAAALERAARVLDGDPRDTITREAARWQIVMQKRIRALAPPALGGKPDHAFVPWGLEDAGDGCCALVGELERGARRCDRPESEHTPAPAPPPTPVPLLDAVRLALHTMQGPMAEMEKRCIADRPHNHDHLRALRESMRILQTAHDAALRAPAPKADPREDAGFWRQRYEAAVKVSYQIETDLKTAEERVEAWQHHFAELCDAMFPESVGRPRLIAWGDLQKRATEWAGLLRECEKKVRHMLDCETREQTRNNEAAALLAKLAARAGR